jgi:hypothetical protein
MLGISNPGHRGVGGGALVAAATLLLLALLVLTPLPARGAITLLVTTTELDVEIGDGCGLFEAIQAANQDAQFGDCFGEAGTNAIDFDIQGGGPHVIAPATALPAITAAVTIDGTSEPDYAPGAPVVVLDGSSGALYGLRIGATGDGTTIRGMVVHSFDGNGLEALPGGDGNTFEANFVGTDQTGATDLGNSGDGISAFSLNNVVGGSGANEGNLVSGNDGNGIVVADDGVVQGNLVGTDAAGTAPLGNGLTGIWVRGPDADIGGPAAGAGNVVGANGGDGIELQSSDVTIQNNAIGTDAAGTVDLGNDGHGVFLIGGLAGTTIGGSAAGEANMIANNDGNGILTLSNTGVGNAFLVNSVHDNAALGIDLGNDGVTPNDPDDADTGANDFQNFPEISDVTPGATTTVEGDLHTDAASTFYRLEFFVQDQADPTEFGEGETFLGDGEVQTDGNGDAPFTIAGLDATAAPDVVTATATRLTGSGGDPLSTSEYSEAFHLCTVTGTNNDDDPLPGTPGNDVICALDGEDRITASGGNDVIIGGAGTDEVSYTSAAAPLTIDLAEGAASGGPKTDTLLGIEDATGGSGADTMSGVEGQVNELNGGLGADTIDYSDEFACNVDLDAETASDGGLAVDTIISFRHATGTPGTDTFAGVPGVPNTFDGNGAGGINFVNYVSAPGPVTVDLPMQQATDDGGGTIDTLLDIDSAFGSSQADQLTGDEAVNNFTALGGDDSMVGGGGDDVLDGGTGVDTADYSTNTEPIVANLDAGTVDGASTDDLTAIEVIEGSPFDDTFVDEAGVDNTYNGGNGTDRVTYAPAPGATVVTLGTDQTVNDGDGSTDSLPSIEDATGSGFGDTITGDTEPNALVGGGGNDTISGADGGDAIAGEGGNDTVSGGEGDDDADGGDGADTINGDGGDDDLSGDAGNDALLGSAGDDTLTGGDGDDDLRGEGGIDTLEGAGGNDFANGGSDNDTVRGGEGDDTVLGEGGNDIVLGENGNDVVSGGDGNDTTDAGEGADSVLGEGGDDVLMGLGGNDTLTGGEGNDTATGGGGKDTAVGQGGSDTLKGQGGNDTLKGGGGKDTLKGGGGKDRCVGGGGKDKQSSCET